MKSNWLLRHALRPRATARLFCFSYAGAGASAYRLWPKELPGEVDVCAVQPPGREDRLRETPLRSISAFVESLLPVLLPQLDLPFAFFGHSMGSIIAMEVARALEASGGPMPKHLFVSARRAPSLPRTETPLNPLTDEAFLTEVQQRYGGIPEEVLREPELIALLLPCLRADIAALEAYRPVPNRPLSCPISAFGGTEDFLTSHQDLEAWSAETRALFRVRVFPGGHFYLVPHRTELIADIAMTMAPFVPRSTEANA